ncbi:MAG: hypothetical protein M0035_07725, partial [Actinomycetota bacterium]|nr:hypothetical protein [Actinomycetota bacterium]
MSRASRPRWPLAIAAAAVLVAAIAAAAVLPGSASPPAAGHAVASLATIAGEVCSPAAATAQGMVPDGLASGPNGGFYVSVADQVHSEVCHVSASGAVSLAAGDGTPGYLPAPYGDATAATGAELYNPAGLAFDGGELYIADRFNNRVRLVDTSGVITTVAGDGASGGPLSAPGPATSVALDRPSAVVVSSSGDVYVADSSANEVLELSPSGRLSVFAGTGVAGYSGDGGPATQAELSFPTALALSSNGDLYIADSGNNRIRMVSPSGVITTVAGTGVAGYSGDGGPATQAELFDPSGLALSSNGDLYIADSGNNRIRMVSPSGVITTVAGTGVAGFSGDGGPATQAELSFPTAIALSSTGALLIADGGNRRVREVSPTGTITTVAGNGTLGLSGDGGPATQAGLSEPLGVAAGPGGIYVADAWNDVVRRILPSGVIETVAGAADGLQFPVAVALNAAGDIFVADWSNRVIEVTPSGAARTVAGTGVAGFSGDGGPAVKAELDRPSGLAVAPNGDLYIADSGNNRIRMVSPNGIITTIAGTGVAGFSG